MRSLPHLTIALCILIAHSFVTAKVAHAEDAGAAENRIVIELFAKNTWNQEVPWLTMDRDGHEFMDARGHAVSYGGITGYVEYVEKNPTKKETLVLVSIAHGDEEMPVTKFSEIVLKIRDAVERAHPKKTVRIGIMIPQPETPAPSTLGAEGKSK